MSTKTNEATAAPARNDNGDSPSGRIVRDPELQAISRASGLLLALDEPTRWRVMAYLWGRFGPPTPLSGSAGDHC